MKPIRHRPPGVGTELASFVACLATVLELAPETVPAPGPDEDGPTGWTLSRWLGGLGMGLVEVSEPRSFTWPGPWLGRVAAGRDGERRFVVMYGVPSGVVWDPAGDGPVDGGALDAGYVVAATDIALARPLLPEPPDGAGRVERIWLADAAGKPAIGVDTACALAGRGLDGDRHVTGRGSFPSGPPGSALTLIEAEVCESFAPPLRPDDHRRNLVTRGIALNRLVGHEFTVGAVRCRGARLCEPCTVIQRYAARPVLRELVHRGGLRADILSDGEISVGDPIEALARGAAQRGPARPTRAETP